MQSKTRRIAALAGLAVAASALAVSSASAATVDVITEDDVVRQAENTPPTNDWVLYTRTAASVGAFVNGPATPPSGTGSLHLATPTGGDKVTLFNYDHVGMALADIDAMSYATYRDSGGAPNQVPAINIQVDENGPADGGFTHLVFEPVYNTSQGPIVEDTWQTWDAFNGGQAIWWSSRAIPGVCAFDCFVTWDAILAANPDATIVGGYGINQGSGNPALLANADALVINDTLYNFEGFADGNDDGIPDSAPATKDDCKKDGWKTFNNPSFKNQGDCVSSVAKKK